MSDTLRPLWEAGALLGEGPIWSATEARLYWVDIKGKQVHSCDEVGGKRYSFTLPDQVGAVALRREGGLLIALREGPALRDEITGAITYLCKPEQEFPGNRFNDGACDRAGRFWAGTMDDACTDPTGGLYRIEPTGEATQVMNGFIVTNGIGWSPDDTVIYVTDSEAGSILRCSFDLATGHVGRPVTFATTGPGEGLPDGLTIDAEGHIWSAHWDGWRITRYRPDGSVERVIETPVPRPTSVTFGGARLDRLYVTSASLELDDATLEKAPLSGALFVCEPGVQGLPEPTFAG